LSVKTIEKMVEWIEDNIKGSPTLEEMASHVRYSSYYCSIKFHEYLGITFKQYIAKRRLSLAEAEIKNTNRRFLDIALDYGFSSQEAFTRAFANAYGSTPYKYRKQKPDVFLSGRP
jgi:AraC-type DNA-binding domain-containing proteins